MLYLIIPILLLYLLWLFCVHMDEKELSDRQTKALPQKELHEPFQSESESKKKGVLPVRDFYYRFRKNDEEEETEQNLEKKRKPEEPPHDHQEDHQQDPPPALRERRRPLFRPREDEEEDDEEEDQSTQTETSPVQDSSVQTNKVMTIENGTQEEWRHEEDVSDILIVKKDGETQTTIFQEDKGVDARLDMKDTETQISPVREDQATQVMPKTKDIGTGEWLALQKSIGVGNHIETSEKGLGELLETQDKAIQARAEQKDKLLQINSEYRTTGNDAIHIRLNNKSIQVFPSFKEEAIQKDISMADKSVQEQQNGLALSSILKKENMPSEGEDGLSLEYSPSPLKRRASSSPSFDSEEGILKQMPTIISHYLPSSSGIEFEDSLVQVEPMGKPPLPRRRIGSMESIESLYPSHSQFPSKIEESEVIFSGFHKHPSLVVSEFIEEERKESQNVISFSSSSKKEESEDFEVIQKPIPSRHSSFSIMDDEKD